MFFCHCCDNFNFAYSFSIVHIVLAHKIQNSSNQSCFTANKRSRSNKQTGEHFTKYRMYMCKGADWWVRHQCKDAQCLVLQVLCGGQLRFSLSSGTVTRYWSQFFLFIALLVLAQLMQSYASHVLPSLLRCCSCFLCLLYMSLLILQLFCCLSLSAILGFCSPLLYTTYLTVHAGIACLCCACSDSMSDSPDLWWPQLHAGIACLASLAYDWMTACWDHLSLLLHAWIVCVASMACDQAIACWDSMATLRMLG